MSALGAALAMAGTLLLVVSALGLFLLPDALSRQHAATKSATLALGLLLAGCALASGQPGWWPRVLLIVGLLLLTLPVASHMLGRAAYHGGTDPGPPPADR